MKEVNDLDDPQHMNEQLRQATDLNEAAGEAAREAPAAELPGVSMVDQDEATALRDRLARLQAEFENARKRAVKEQEDFREYAALETVKSLIPVLDSFDTALKASPSDQREFRRGMELIQKQLLDALFKVGVQPIDAVGKRFNPELHHAVGTVETATVEDEYVIEELQQGYKFKDRLLRPSMVRVATRAR